jgi:hypothetical protein
MDLLAERSRNGGNVRLRTSCSAFLFLLVLTLSVTSACLEASALPTSRSLGDVAQTSSILQSRVDVLPPFNPVEGYSRLLVYVQTHQYSQPIEIIDGRSDHRGALIGTMTPTESGANGELSYSGEFTVGMVSGLKRYPLDQYEYVLLVHFTNRVDLDSTPAVRVLNIPDMGVVLGTISLVDVTGTYGVLVSDGVQYNFTAELRFQVARIGMSLLLPVLLISLGLVLSMVGYMYAHKEDQFLQVLLAIFFLALTNFQYVRVQMLQAPFFTLMDGLVFVPVVQIVLMALPRLWPRFLSTMRIRVAFSFILYVGCLLVPAVAVWLG